MVSARARLASTLLSLCWAASAVSGCLLSQEDRVLNNIPAQRNRPPRIMEELPITPGNRLTVVESDCPQLKFEFSAEDPDVDEVLTVRWYVDYPRTRFFVLPEQLLFPNDVVLERKPQRDDRGSLTVNLASQLDLPLSLLQSFGPHVVEAVLYDFHLGPDRNPLPISGADGGILNPSYAVTYAWVVDMRRTCPGP